MDYIVKQEMIGLLSETKLYGTLTATSGEGVRGSISTYDMGNGHERRITLSADMVIFETFENGTLVKELFTYMADHSDTAVQNRMSPTLKPKPQGNKKGKGSNKDKRPKW